MDEGRCVGGSGFFVLGNGPRQRLDLSGTILSDCSCRNVKMADGFDGGVVVWRTQPIRADRRAFSLNEPHFQQVCVFNSLFGARWVRISETREYRTVLADLEFSPIITDSGHDRTNTHLPHVKQRNEMLTLPAMIIVLSVQLLHATHVSDLTTEPDKFYLSFGQNGTNCFQEDPCHSLDKALKSEYSRFVTTIEVTTATLYDVCAFDSKHFQTGSVSLSGTGGHGTGLFGSGCIVVRGNPSKAMKLEIGPLTIGSTRKTKTAGKVPYIFCVEQYGHLKVSSIAIRPIDNPFRHAKTFTFKGKCTDWNGKNAVFYSKRGELEVTFFDNMDESLGDFHLENPVLHEKKTFALPLLNRERNFPHQIYCESDQETIIKLPASLYNDRNPQNSLMLTIKGRGCTFQSSDGFLSSHSFVGNKASGNFLDFFPVVWATERGNFTKNGFEEDETNFKHYRIELHGTDLYPCALNDFKVEFSPLIAGNSTAEYKHWTKAKFVWGFREIRNDGPSFYAHDLYGQDTKIAVAIPRKSIEAHTHYSLRLSKGDYKTIIPCAVMIPLPLLLSLFQSIFAVPSRTPGPANLQSLMDIISNIPNTNSNEIQPTSIAGGTYIGTNIEIKDRRLGLSGEQSNKRTSPGTHIVSQSGSDNSRNEERFPVHSGNEYVFSLTNSTLSLKSLHFLLTTNSEKSRKQRNEAHTAWLAIVSDSMLTISESILEVSSGTSAILISPSTFEESTTQSSVVMKKCSISSERGQLRGLVETSAFPDCGASRSISIVDCSFNSQEVLGTDGIGLSLTQTPRKRNEDVGMISSSLIGCSFVNMSSIGSSRQPQLSHLSQNMLGCVVSLTSSHLSGSTIRDVNNGGSVLCSNSSFSSLLSSPNTDSDQPSITLPSGPSTFVDGTAYSFKYDIDGDENTFATFSHCHFTGANYVTNARPLYFYNYVGTVSVLFCSFTNHAIERETYNSVGGALCLTQIDKRALKPVTVKASNFTKIRTDMDGAGMWLYIQLSATIVDCIIEDCAPPDGSGLANAGMEFLLYEFSGLVTMTNLVFTSCHAVTFVGGMHLQSNGAICLSDCCFNDCVGQRADALVLDLWGDTSIEVARMTFTDCCSTQSFGGMTCYARCDVQATELHFFRCKSAVFEGTLDQTLALTVQDCSFVECSSPSRGGAFDLTKFMSYVINDCLVKDCSSLTTGGINLWQLYHNQTSISFTRVAFVNNSVG
ncbi:hypothetical protein BLNAU_19527 [Blattamonas nauphoetae]|uniref:Right handed beta helix domain-containing protein n=1 Tax=Blattamonas nauphoetae TaxID=2049346 RepID=A0ABQ9X1K7_9EUKA|nr:hypothetical protein BLNAU_19527 [Blattamonas nauphoetae]